MNQINLYTKTWYIKFFDGFFLTLVFLFIISGLVSFLPEKSAELYLKYLQLSNQFLIIIPALAGVLYVLVSNKREKSGAFNSEKTHAIIWGLIRFWLAAGIATYGFGKILGTQFTTPTISVRDTLAGDLTGRKLTWFYFEYSPAFTLIIGWLQIVGSLLLLFRRTTLLGIFILLPVMLNIVLINLFYGIHPGATRNSIVYTGGLTYLLLLHAKNLIILFLKPNYTLPKIGSVVFKNVLRIVVVVYAFMGVYQYLIKFHDEFKPGDPEILGKWKVDQMIINGNEKLANAWQTDTSAWASIYFNDAKFCIIGSNPFYFDQAKAIRGEYKFDKPKHLLDISFNSLPDTLHVSIDSASLNKMLLNGKLGKDTVTLRLTRVKM
jgi:hypothetical protein